MLKIENKHGWPPPPNLDTRNRGIPSLLVQELVRGEQKQRPVWAAFMWSFHEKRLVEFCP